MMLRVITPGQVVDDLVLGGIWSREPSPQPLHQCRREREDDAGLAEVQNQLILMME